MSREVVFGFVLNLSKRIRATRQLARADRGQKGLYQAKKRRRFYAEKLRLLRRECWHWYRALPEDGSRGCLRSPAAFAGWRPKR
jgi:hypothetical protein